MNRSRFVFWLPFFPIMTIVFLAAPVLSGLLGVILPAFGYFPFLGGKGWGWHIFAEVFAHPAFFHSAGLTLLSGMLSTLLSLVLALNIVSMSFRNRGLYKLRGLLIPLLAVPHAASAFGLAFLIAPGGWVMRWSVWISGGEALPPDWIILGDPWGISLMLGLILKETPYLILMILALMPQVHAVESLRVATSLGYVINGAWWRVVVPRLLPLLRLPVFAVLAYSISTVDMALILGPSTPPTLAVLLLRWLEDPDLGMRFHAAAAGVILLLMAISMGAVFYGMEMWRFRFFRSWMLKGPSPRERTIHFVPVAAWSLFFVSILGLLVLGLWSFAYRWSWPSILPTEWTLLNWKRHGVDVMDTLALTIGIGLAATILAAVLTVGCLENERWRRVRFSRAGAWLLYAPLLIPQATFLLGLQIMAVWLRLDGSWTLLLWTHFLFVLPYLFIAVAEAWRSFDRRYETTALCLGRTSWEVFLRVKLPLLLKPLLIGCAIGFAVSIAQYLPTLFAGAGKLATLTTEAVGRASGADRRVIGVYGFLQAALPLLALGGALIFSNRLARNRKIVAGIM